MSEDCAVLCQECRVEIAGWQRRYFGFWNLSFFSFFRIVCVFGFVGKYVVKKGLEKKPITK